MPILRFTVKKVLCFCLLMRLASAKARYRYRHPSQVPATCQMRHERTCQRHLLTLWVTAHVACRQILGLKDVYIPTLFSSTGKSTPFIRASAVCMGAPRPWQSYYNETPEATLSEVRCPLPTPARG